MRSTELFRELAVGFFRSRGHQVDWLDQESGLIELRDRDLRQGLGRAVRILLFSDGGATDPRRIPVDVDYIVRDDSPLRRADEDAAQGERDLLDRRFSYVPRYDLGRQILFPRCSEWVAEELSTFEAGQATTPPPVSHVGESHSSQELICGNRRSEVFAAMQHKRRGLLEGLRRSTSTPLTLPVALPAHDVQSRGVLASLRSALTGASGEPLSEALLQVAFQLGYVVPFIDRLEAWSLDGDLDPNRGVFAEFLLRAGKTGRFVLGCDKSFVFHFPARDLRGRRETETERAGDLKAVGERFHDDSDLSLLVVDETRDVVPRGNEDAETRLEGHWKQTRGLLGRSEWRTLLQRMAVRLISQEGSGYLSPIEVRDLIDGILPDDRTLKPNTDHVLRILLQSNLFDQDPSEGIRFRDAELAELMVSEALQRCMEDLWEFGETHESSVSRGASSNWTQDPYLLAFAGMVTLRQVNDRILYRALRKFGGGARGHHRCAQLWGQRLKWLLAREDLSTTAESPIPPALRCSLLRFANVLVSWMRVEGTGIDGGAWSPFEGIIPNLSRIEGRQIYLSGLDLAKADFSASALPFLCLDACNLEGANFEYSYLVSSSFTQCNLKDASFRAADLSGAEMRQNTGLNPSNFQGTALWAADLEKAVDDGLADAVAIVAASGRDNCRFAKFPGAAETASAEGPALGQDMGDPEYLEALLVSSHAKPDCPPQGQRSLWRHLPFQLDLEQEGARTSLSISDSQGVTWRLENVASFDAVPAVTREGLRVALVSPNGSVSLTTVHRAQPRVADPRIVFEPQQQAAAEPRTVIARFLDRNRLVVCRFPEEIAVLPLDDEGRTGAPTSLSPQAVGIQQGAVGVQHASLGHREFLIVGGSKGGLFVFGVGGNRSSALADTASLRFLNSHEESSSPPTAFGWIPQHGQVLVARQDKSFDVYTLSDDGSLLRLASFLLAHDQIQTIITDAARDKYLVVGTKFAETGSEALVALCNADLEVLAVWPAMSPTGGSLTRQVLNEQWSRLARRDGDTGSPQAPQDSEVSREELRDLLDAFRFDSCGTVEKGHRTILEYRLRFPIERAREGRYGPQAPLSLGTSRQMQYLLYQFSISRPGSPLQRDIPASSIEVARRIDGQDVLLEFRFEHPFLNSRTTRFLRHEVNLRLAFPSDRDEGGGEEACRDFEVRGVQVGRSNPFHYGPPVSGSSFYGYEKEIEDLTAKLLVPNTTLTVTGARRMGKSSFTLQLASKLSAVNHVVVVRFDIEPQHESKAALFRSIVERLPAALQAKHLYGHDLSGLLPLCDKGQDSFFTGLFQFLEERVQLSQPVLVLMLDELGHIYQLPEAADGEPQAHPTSFINAESVRAQRFWLNLLPLYENYSDRLRIVLAGLPAHFTPEFADARLHSGVQRYALKPGFIHHVGPLASHQVEALVREKLAEEESTITDGALEHCRRLCSDIPHDAQLLMHLAFERWKRQLAAAHVAEPIDVQHFLGVEEALAEHYEQYREAIWMNLQEDTRRWLEEEAMKDSPAWEEDPMGLGAEFLALEGMGYYRRASHGRKTLFVPRGLTLSIARAVRRRVEEQAGLGASVALPSASV